MENFAFQIGDIVHRNRSRALAADPTVQIRIEYEQAQSEAKRLPSDRAHLQPKAHFLQPRLFAWWRRSRAPSRG